jgi:hypothetical protein
MGSICSKAGESTNGFAPDGRLLHEETPENKQIICEKLMRAELPVAA